MGRSAAAKDIATDIMQDLSYSSRGSQNIFLISESCPPYCPIPFDAWCRHDGPQQEDLPEPCNGYVP